MIRTLAVALVYAGVTLRALVYFADDPQRAPAIIILALYGLLLFAGPYVIRRAGVVEQEPASRMGVILPFAYLLVQTALVSALLRVPVTRDFIAALYMPLSMDAVLYFGPRAGFLWIAAFSLAMVGPLASSTAGLLFGMVMTALFSGFNLMCGLYAHQLQKADASRRRTQRLIADLQEAHQQLQGYVSQAEEISAEQERGRLARELHDSVTQTLFSMNLTAQGAALLFAREPGRVAAQLERLEELAAGAMSEIQALVSHLRPHPASGEGLSAALRRLTSERSAQSGLPIAFEESGEGALAPPAAIGLYAITQEALNNVARHAVPGRAVVRLKLAAGGSWLEIEDDGPGFDPPSALATPGHLGLTGMADRAREIGWTLVIDSARGRGTRILVHEGPAQ